MDHKYKRIVTHTDFDGTISALFLREMFNIDNIRFTEPWLIQTGDFWIKKGDIIVDLPFHEKASLWIDHHESTSHFNNGEKNRIHDSSKKSCPDLIFEKFHKEYSVLEELKYLIKPCNKIDAGELTKEDLDNPDAYGLLSMSLRSDDRKKDDEFRLFLINILSFTHAEKAVEQPIIKARIQARLDEIKEWKTKIKNYVKVYEKEKIIVVDTSEAEDLPRGQKFFLYLMYPGNNYSILIDKITNDSSLLKISIGKNIFKDFESKVDISEIMKEFGGGGHKDVGGCSINKTDKDKFIKELVKKLKI